MKTDPNGIETYCEIHAGAAGSQRVILSKAAHRANLEAAEGLKRSPGDILRSAS